MEAVHTHHAAGRKLPQYAEGPEELAHDGGSQADRDHVSRGASSAFFFIGGILALLIRIEMLTPKQTIMTAETYNQVFTLARRDHGVPVHHSVGTRRRSGTSSCL